MPQYSAGEDGDVCKLDTLRLKQNGRHFPDNISKCIFLNENVPVAIIILLKFIIKGSITKYSGFGSDNGLSPSRRQAITWTYEV